MYVLETKKTNDFKDCLTELRRAKGLSQEDLAGQLGVSRQAVSKWETGEAMPDMGKLIALADALDVSIDALCGRSAGGAAAEAPAGGPSKPARTRHPVLRTVLAVLVAVAVLGGVWFGSNLQRPETLPDTVTADLTELMLDRDQGGVVCRFIPSVASADCTYQVSVTGAGAGWTVDAEYENGVCTAVLQMLQGQGYVISARICRGDDIRSVVLAEQVNVGEDSVMYAPAKT